MTPDSDLCTEGWPLLFVLGLQPMESVRQKQLKSLLICQYTDKFGYLLTKGQAHFIINSHNQLVLTINLPSAPYTTLNPNDTSLR